VRVQYPWEKSAKSVNEAKQNTELRLLAVRGPVLEWPQEWCLESYYTLKAAKKNKTKAFESYPLRISAKRLGYFNIKRAFSNFLKIVSSTRTLHLKFSWVKHTVLNRFEYSIITRNLVGIKVNTYFYSFFNYPYLHFIYRGTKNECIALKADDDR